jgi:hypothetical protein
VLQAGAETHEGQARALHALLYARELREAGATVRLVFDGAGTEWLARLRDPEQASGRLAELFRELTRAGLTYEVCDDCSGAFHVRDQLVAAGAQDPFAARALGYADAIAEGRDPIAPSGQRLDLSKATVVVAPPTPPGPAGTLVGADLRRRARQPRPPDPQERCAWTIAIPSTSMASQR